MTNPFPWTDVSIDIETLGTKYNAPLLSIGAVAFSRLNGTIGPTYYQEIDIDSAIKAGTVNASTVAWWIDQNKSAKRIFDMSTEGVKKKMHLSSALLNFTTWGRSLGAPRVWGNGATFDITIIEHAIDRGSVGLEPPWVYWNVRDVRTIVDVATAIKGWDKQAVPREGVHHNAVDDAVYQAKLVLSAFKALGGTFTAPAKSVKTKAVAQAPAVDDDL